MTKTGGSGSLDAVATFNDSNGLAATDGDAFILTGAGGVTVGDVVETRGFEKSVNNGLFVVKAVTAGGVEVEQVDGQPVTLLAETAGSGAELVLTSLSYDNVAVGFNDGRTGLRLVEIASASTFDPASEIFMVTPVNGSRAAFDLRLVSMEGRSDVDGDGVIDREDGYGIIEGGQVKGPTLFDRFFIENAIVGASLSIDAGPGADGVPDPMGSPNDDILASATFGDFVSIGLKGDGALGVEVQTGLKDPDTGVLGDRVTLTELIQGLGDITSVIATPSFTTTGGLDLGVFIDPAIPGLIDLAGLPRVQIGLDGFAVSLTGGSFGPDAFNLGDGSFDIRLDVPGVGQRTVTVSLAGVDFTGVTDTAGFETAINTAMTNALDTALAADFPGGVPSLLTASLEDALGLGTSFGLKLSAAVGSGLESFSVANAVGSAAAVLGFDAGAFGDIADQVADLLPDLDFDLDGDLGDLLDFGNLDFGFSAILDALILLSDFLGQFEEFGFLNDDLPLINVSVNDLLSFADDLDAAITAAQANPAGAIQQLETTLEDALGIPPSQLTLSLDEFDPNSTPGDGDEIDMLKIEIALQSGFSEVTSLSIPNIPALGEVLDLSGAADLDVSGSLTARLDIGVSFSDPTDIFVYNTTGLFGDLNANATELEFMAALGPFGLFIEEGPNGELAFATANAAIKAGLDLDQDGTVDEGVGSVDRILIGNLVSNLGGNLAVDVTGSLEVNLPIYAPISSKFQGVLRVEFDDTTDWQNLDLASGITLPDFDLSFDELGLFDSILLAVDGIDLFLGGLQDILDGEVFGLEIPFIGDKLSSGANFIQDFRDGFLSDFRDFVETGKDLAQDFEDPNLNPLSVKLFELLGPEGLGLLLESDGTAADIGDAIGDVITLNTDGDSFVEWDLSIGGMAGVGTTADFDFGIPGFGIEADGGIGLAFDWDLDFGFGLSLDEGFYLKVDDSNELTVALQAILPTQLTGRLAFLQLTANDKNDPNDQIADLGLAFELDIFNKSNRAEPKLGLAQFGRIGFEIGIAAIAQAELALALGLNNDLFDLPPSVAGGIPEIRANLLFEWSLLDDGGVFNSADPETSDFLTIYSDDGSVEPVGIGNAIKDGLKRVAFENVGLDVGSFLSDVLGPIVGKVKEITDPVQPLIEVITTPIPVLSDLGPPVTLLDLAASFGKVDPGLIYAIADVISLINRIPDPANAGELVIPLGDFKIFDADLPGFDGLDLTNPNLNLGDELDGLLDQNAIGDIDFDSLLETAPGDAQTKGTVEDLRSGDAGGGFSFPVFDDPSQIFGILMGEPATLVAYDMAPLVFEFEWSQFFSIFGPLGVSINIEFGAEIDFDFGYDTLGIQQFVEGGFVNPGALLNGFFIGDVVDGVDVPEISLFGRLFAAAELNLAIAKAGVAGGIGAEINFNLFDPNADGKVRIEELIGNFENQLRAPNDADKFLAPLAIFDVTGEIFAELFAFLKIDLFFFSLDKKFDITPRVTLLDFEIDFFRPPKLATELDNGDLILNLGEFSESRLLGDLSDGDETFEIKGVDGDTIAIRAQGLGSDALVFQEYDVTGKVIVKGGAGVDTITIVPGGAPINVGFEVESGAGDDVIDLSLLAGAALIRGGDGDDVIKTGSGADLVFGGAGNDIIEAGAGNDIIFADPTEFTGPSLIDTNGDDTGDTAVLNLVAESTLTDGDDIIMGGDDSDILFGGGGMDQIHGGDAADIVIGDGGRVIVPVDNVEDGNIQWAGIGGFEVSDTDRGSAGDTLLGNGGPDRIYGGPDDDRIDGGAGPDEIYGESGNDTIYGGSDADIIYADSGNDTVYGFRDTLTPFEYADTGDTDHDRGDVIYGQEGDDEIHGGDDVAIGDNKGDQIFGDSGEDTIFGDAGEDTIFGQGDDDEIHGGAGPDIIYGGADDDRMFGDAGPDVIYAGIGSDFADGGADGDKYNVDFLGGKNDAVTAIEDSGPGLLDGEDIIEVFTTNGDDHVLLRATVNTDNGFIALLNEAQAVERVNYNGAIESFVVNTLFGNDVVALDDTRALGTVNLGLGDDFIQIGQLFRSPRDMANANVAPADKPEVIETTRGFLTNGVSFDLTVNGGLGNDEFVVYHNEASLVLNGNAGDDLFLIKAFALAGSKDPDQSRMDLTGGGGADTIQYVVNAPVFINGGDGFDRVIIIGTEFQDNFVITDEGVFGAGLNVNYINIEGLVVDGAEGDDRFFVQSTDPSVLTEVVGGLGSDSFSVGGDTPAVVSNDLKGHSGLIVHGIENNGPEYASDLPVAGISANVADNDAPGIVVTPSAEVMKLVEGGMALTYTVVLTREPKSSVNVLAVAPKLAPDEVARGFETIQFVGPFSTTVLSDPSDPDSPVLSAAGLEFKAEDWWIPKTVEVIAIADAVSEGPFDIAITHKVTSDDSITNTNADGVVLEQVAEVTRRTLTIDSGPFADEDLSGAVLTLTSPQGVSKTRVIESNTATTLTLIGDDWLTRPGLIAADGAATSAGAATLTDTEADFGGTDSLVGKFVRIVEGSGTGQVRRIIGNTGTELSLDSAWTEQPEAGSLYEVYDTVDYAIEVTRYDGLRIPIVQMQVVDAQQAGVDITETDGTTRLREGQADGETFDVALTRAPTEPVTVTLTADSQVDLSYDSDSTGPGDRALDLVFMPGEVGPKTVSIEPIFDMTVEGFHFGNVTGVTVSADGDQTLPATAETFPAVDPATGAQDPTSVDLSRVPKEGTVSVTVDGGALPDSVSFQVFSNTVLFVNAAGKPVKVGGTIVVNYSYVEPGYDGALVRRLNASIADYDAPGVLITQTRGSTDVIEFDGSIIPSFDEPVTIEDTVFTGNTLEFKFAPDAAFVPGGDATLIVDATADLDLDTEFITLEAEGIALGNVFEEALSGGTITSTTAQATLNLTLAQVQSLLADDGKITITATPSVEVNDFTPTDPNSLSLRLSLPADSSATADALGLGRVDTYTVVLTSPPTQDVEVRVRPEETVTSLVVDAAVQLAVDKTVLTFTPANWFIPQEVAVFAIDDPVVDGGDVKVFAPQLHTVAPVQGPLLIQGGGGFGSLAVVGPLMLPGETNIKPPTGDAQAVTADSITVLKQDVLDVVGVIELEDLKGKSVEFTAVSHERSEALVDQFRLIVDFIDHEDGTVELIVNEDWEIPAGAPADATLDDVTRYAITNESANFFDVEEEQSDWLIVNDSDSVASFSGRLSESTLEGYEVNLSGLGMGIDTVVGFGSSAKLFPGGITYGDLEYVEINLGDGDNDMTVEATGARVDLETGESGFRTWTVIRTDRGQDTVTVSLRDDTVELLVDEALTSFTDTTITNAAGIFGAADSLAGKLLHITEGLGVGQVRKIASNTATTLTVDQAFDEEGFDSTTRFRVIDPLDGRVTIDLGEGNDTLMGGDSSIPLIVFGNAGDDHIVGGSGGDTLFGDLGRIDYTGETGELITRLGDAPQAPNLDNDFIPALVNLVPFRGDVASATASMLTRAIGSSDAFPVNEQYPDGELAGLQVFITAGTGKDQGRIIASNTGDTLTLIEDWNVVPDSTSRFSIFGQGELQTDGVLRDPSLILSIGETTGGADTIIGNGGDDTIFGGPGGDPDLQGNAGDDTIFGDNGRIDYTPVRAPGDIPVFGETAETRTKQAQSIHIAFGGEDVIHGGAGVDTVLGGFAGDTLYGDDATAGAGAADGGDVLIGDNGELVYDPLVSGEYPRIRLIRTTDIANETGGADTITGNAGDDVVLGGVNSSPDVLSGSGGDDILLGDNGELIYDDALDPDLSTLDIVRTFRDSLGGGDIVSGDAGSDVVLGGTGGDTLFGDNAAGSGGSVDLRDYIIGDNGEILLLNNLITDVVTTDMTEATGGDDTISGNAGSDHVLGGVGADLIHGDLQTPGLWDGHDVIVGDQGIFEYNLASPFDGDPTTLDRIRTKDTGLGGDDTIFGDDQDDVVLAGTGDDLVRGNAGNDLVIGDFGEVRFGSVTVTQLGVVTDRKEYALHATITDNALGGVDTVYGDGDEDVIVGGAFGDHLDGGAQDDLVFGDNVTLDRNGAALSDFTNPRFREQAVDADNARPIPGALFDLDGQVQVGAAAQNIPALTGTPVWGNWEITLVDHKNTTTGNRFGDDYIAGGAHDDQIFGQLGNDTIQGDGSIDITVGADRTAGVLTVDASVEDLDGLGTDGDDYIEGNGGDDVIFGNLGQDDIVGGNSDLFSLTTPDRRPDGSDLIFGGAGTDISRNHLGDASLNAAGDTVVTVDGGHARDADVILGDNGDIFRAVTGAGANAASTYRSFVYDDYTGGLRLIPRAPQLLDYTPGGERGAAPAADIGAADELHGESGDDAIYGQKGDDIAFGEGQDDDLIGGYGNDWISGGTGSDGVIGDDGRIVTSRNNATVGEPLHGVAPLLASDPSSKDSNGNVLNEEISTPGSIQQATINIAGQLKKAVDLTPFSVDPDWVGTADEFDGETVPHHSDDILYGGWGDDWLHGGSGDDAASGAEALPGFYSNPVNPGDVLGYGLLQGGEFAAYDEFDPLSKIDGFLLNFNADEGPIVGIVDGVTFFTDGDDKIFGDMGNDWLVGGTGRDDLYGGWGDDLMNADDDHSTNSDANDQPDTHPTYEDRAYGGAGRDVLIGNTGGDRLIDWVGEFNSYLVPFAPFGMGTVSRTLQPQLSEFLYALSSSDGADPTRVGDIGASADPARNGEPFGELGLVRQQDFAWQAQTGAPDDPQAGNIPGGKRDVLRSAGFDQPQMTGFFTDSGVWSVQNGVLTVSAESLGSDAVSVFHVGDALPGYFELQASVMAIKPTAGWKANSYMIFDYQSKDDFKFAGLDVSINKLVMGHRDATGWHVDEQAPVPGGVKSGKYFNLLLAVNGLNATLVLNNSDVFSHTYQPRVVDGFSYGLNWGLVGVGSDNARGAFDNIQVQILPPQVTFDETEDFEDGVADRFTGDTAGSWTVSDGRYGVTPGSETGMSLIDLGPDNLHVSSYLELNANVNTEGRAGFIFDRYGDVSFKFVMIDAVADEVVIGHHTAKRGWVNDAVVTTTIDTGVDYTLGVALKGSTVSVTVDGQTVLGHAFNAVTVDGQFGLLATDGPADFDDVRVKTDDPAFATPSAALMASAPATQPAEAGDVLTYDALAPILAEAARRLSMTLGSHAPSIDLSNVTIQITDLPGLTLGAYADHVIQIDKDAAGHGWFIDETPEDDTEFRHRSSDGLRAMLNSDAFGRMDLLTVLIHEVGHAMGLEHDDDGGLMVPTLASGIRLTANSVDDLDVIPVRSETRYDWPELSRSQRLVLTDLEDVAVRLGY